MSLKGKIKADHIPLNNYELIGAGAPPLVFTEISGIEEELETVDLPDRSKASGGNTKPIEFTVMQPQHHTVEVAYMEQWFLAAQNQLPGYKRQYTLQGKPVNPAKPPKSYTLVDLFPTKRKLPDLSMENEGELATIEWTIVGLQVLPV
jgi:hypothetical protein